MVDPRLNARLLALNDYPFDRLRALLDGITPPPGLAPLLLSVGEPRHAPPPLLHEALAAAAGDWGKYPPVDGTPAFRTAAAAWLHRRYRLPGGMIDPDRHILPVAGTREALFLIALVAETGAAERPIVLMPNPFYQVYYGAAVMAGAEPVFMPATAATGFQPALADVPAATLQRTRLAYLCSPANPQGAVADRSTLNEAIALARQHGFLLAVDECYAEIYDREPPPGALEACGASGGGLDNVVVFHSLSKRSSVPGLRSGFVAGDAGVIAAFRRLRAFGGAAQPLPVLAAAAALWSDEAHAADNRRRYREKFDAAERLLAGRFGFYRPAGGFFLWLDVGDGEQAARRLWREAAVRTLPGAYLSKPAADGEDPGRAYLRIALIDDQPLTEEALRRIGNIL
jgi:N-succinyldiaminopimelate aminotransferase